MVIKMNLIIGSHVSFNKDEQLVKSVKEALVIMQIHLCFIQVLHKIQIEVNLI